MSAGWEVGDLAMCLKAGVWRGSVTQVLLPTGPTNGSIHRVTWVGLSRAGRLCLELEGVETPLNSSGLPCPWLADRFRKIKPDQHEGCEPEFVTLLKRSKAGVPVIPVEHLRAIFGDPA